MINSTSTWNTVWLFFWVIACVTYLFALFAVVSDLFRDHKLNEWWRVLWIVFLVFVPFLTLLTYLVARGPGMRLRREQAILQAQDATDNYVRRMMHSESPSEQIDRARILAERGTISSKEFEILKAKALAT